MQFIPKAFWSTEATSRTPLILIYPNIIYQITLLLKLPFFIEFIWGEVREFR